ncbi:hypothetical protein GQR36_24545 [Enterococcus termitis]|nr:hypothetical protein RV18_GL002384 [Enterococcus termitis]
MKNIGKMGKSDHDKSSSIVVSLHFTELDKSATLLNKWRNFNAAYNNQVEQLSRFHRIDVADE